MINKKKASHETKFYSLYLAWWNILLISFLGCSCLIFHARVHQEPWRFFQWFLLLQNSTQRNNNYYYYSHFDNSPQLQQILLYLTYYFFKIIHLWITFETWIKPYIAKTRFCEVLITPLNGNSLGCLPFITTLTLLYLGKINGPRYQRSSCLVGEAISQDTGNSSSNIASKIGRAIGGQAKKTSERLLFRLKR